MTVIVTTATAVAATAAAAFAAVVVRSFRNFALYGEVPRLLAAKAFRSLPLQQPNSALCPSNSHCTGLSQFDG